MIKLTQYCDRFVNGLYYPAILGTNIVLFVDAYVGGQLQGRTVYEVGVPWLLLLLLFILDYVVTAPFSDGKPPHNSVCLLLVDVSSASLFLFAHIQLGLAAKAGAIDTEKWAYLWSVFWLLHGLIMMWCVISCLTAKSRFDPDPLDQKVSEYKKVLKYASLEVVSQAVLIWCVLQLFVSIDEQWQFSVATGLAIIGWIVRRYIAESLYKKYRLWQ